MQKIRNTKKNNTDALNAMFAAEGNIAFLDAEFNAGMDWRAQENVSEVISIGIVICDPLFHELEEFYSLVNPKSNRPVFPLITEITGITTDMLRNQPGFAAVSDKITALMRKYDVTRVFTWGNADQHSLARERQALKTRRYASADHLNTWNYIDLCTDISTAVSSLVLGIRGGLCINIENLMYVCGIDEKQDHNALNDAFYLYKCISYLSAQYPPSRSDSHFRKKKELVSCFYTDRSSYNSFRRFKGTSKEEDLYAIWADAAPEELSLPEDADESDMRIHALMDDIRYLKGDIAIDKQFPSIAEYFSEKLGQTESGR